MRTWRRARDLSQRQLGDVIGHSQSWVWKVEDGRLSPTIDDAVLIARALDVSVADLLPPEHR